jgi:hypothetical protein
LQFIGAPVLVADIALQDPVTQQTLTLDGVLGVNFLVGGLFLSGTDIFTLTFDDFAPSAFDWITFDEPGGVLGLAVNPAFVQPLPGDFNADRSLTGADIDLLRSNFGNPAYDLNGDSLANQDDVNHFIANIIGSRYGDSDLDGDLDGSDFDAWRMRPGYSGAGTGKWASGDFDGDGDVDSTDFDIWRTRPTSWPVGGAPPPVPEPVTWILLVLGAPAIWRRRLQI